MQETIIQKFKRLNADIVRDIDPNASFFKRFRITLDFLWEKLVYKIELIDYIQYRFYYKKRAERNTFVTFGKLLEIMRVCNEESYRHVFDDKTVFNKVFKDYIGREHIALAKATDDEIAKFLARHDKIITKIPEEMFGHGLRIYESAELLNDKKLIQNLKANNVLAEEILEQNQEFAEFNQSSVNSVRVVTLLTANNEVKIMAAVLRVGRAGKMADNFHHQGIAAQIDPDTGIVATMGMDRRWNRYVVHPDSKKPIVGFKIPQWDKIISLAKEAALVCPQIRYIGWDITIKSNNDLVIIEGNSGADPDVTQIQDQIGKWPLFKPYLDEIRSLERK